MHGTLLHFCNLTLNSNAYLIVCGDRYNSNYCAIAAVCTRERESMLCISQIIQVVTMKGVFFNIKVKFVIFFVHR